MARNFINKLVSCGYVPALSGLLIRSSRVSSILLKKAFIIWNLSKFWIVIKNNVHLWDFGVLSARARLSFSKVRPKHFTPKAKKADLFYFTYCGFMQYGFRFTFFTIIFNYISSILTPDYCMTSSYRLAFHDFASHSRVHKLKEYYF